MYVLQHGTLAGSSKRDENERSMALDRGFNRPGLDFEMGAHREAL
jgi:hypothetical protein